MDTACPLWDWGWDSTSVPVSFSSVFECGSSSIIVMTGAAADPSSTKLASLLVHCLLLVLGALREPELEFFWDDNAIEEGPRASLLRKRNWIGICSSGFVVAVVVVVETVRGFRAVELGTRSFWLARWVIVVKGWISRMEEPEWWMWKWASGEWQAQPSRRRRGSGRVRLFFFSCYQSVFRTFFFVLGKREVLPIPAFPQRFKPTIQLPAQLIHTHAPIQDPHR